jgi:RimJ/RimL family protein N-acetyltransferase
LQDPAVHRFLETRHSVQTLESVRGFVAYINAKPDEHLFGIFMKGTDRHIGNVKIGPIVAPHKRADITLLVGAREAWGKGYGSEAILTASRHAVQGFGMEKLTASMYAANLGSYHAFLKAGFKHEGLRRRHLLHDGEMVDMLEVGLIAEELP